ncbi:MAG: hypothetical protein QOK42_977 [Frankiaceae bacterium]|nr:hypothetical protein [Frankiaceae bacterium]
MTDPEAPADDVLEQQQPASGAEAVVGAGGELDLEAPEADAAQQAAETRPEPSYSPPDELTLEADPADVSDQASEVGVDDDDYR